MITSECTEKDDEKITLSFEYALAIAFANKDIDWVQTNMSINQKWGMKGLMDVKRAAWKLIETGSIYG